MSEMSSEGVEQRKHGHRTAVVAPQMVCNPFVHRLHYSCLDKIKIVFFSILIAPIRLLLIGILLLLAWPFAYMGISRRSAEEWKEPMTGWRRWMGIMVTLFCRAVFLVGGFFWVRTKGRLASTKEAPILVVAPHSTFMDALICVHLEMASIVAKLGAKDVPIFGTLTMYTQPVLVDREDPNSRLNTIKEIKRRAQQAGKWPHIIIFPEGTCTNRSCIISYKQGAFSPGVPIQPVVVRYPNRFDSITWTWDGPDAYKVLWLSLCQVYNKIEIEYLPVYYPSDEEKADNKLFARNVRALMAKALNVPISEYSFDDCRLLTKVQKCKLPIQQALFEFQTLREAMGVNADNVRETLQKYITLARSLTNDVSVEELANHLRLPVSPILTQVFKTLSKNKSKINFREFVVALAMVAYPINQGEGIRRAFQIFNDDKEPRVTEVELDLILYHNFGEEVLKESVQGSAASEIFAATKRSHQSSISFEEFVSYAQGKPQLAKAFSSSLSTAAAASSSPRIERKSLRKEENGNALCAPLEGPAHTESARSDAELLEKDKDA